MMSLQGKKVLVLGATGLLGKPLCKKLQEADLEVVRHSISRPADINFDLSEVDEFKKHLQEIQPDFIINLVALTNVDLCEESPEKAYAINALPMKILAEYARSSNAYIIHISTDQVYSGEGPHLEEIPRPVNYYAYSKLVSELYLNGSKGVSLRTNFFGKSLTEGRQSFSDFIYKALSSGENISLADDVYFGPLHYETLSQVIIECLKKTPVGVFNLGAKEGLSKQGFALEMKSILGGNLNFKTISMDDLKLNAKRPKDMRMDLSLIEERLEIKLPTLKEEIERLRNDYGKMEL